MTIKELLSDRSRWTQYDYARDKDGKGCMGNNPNAVCWCLFGAADHIYPRGTTQNRRVKEELQRVVDELFPNNEGITYVNDQLGYEAVMKVVEAAGV